MRKFLVALMMLLTIGLGILGGCSGEKSSMKVSLKDNGALLTNKGMGWDFCYFSNQIYDFGAQLKPGDYLDKFPCDIVYFRFGWNYMEPEDDVYDWDFVDNIIEKWIQRGKRVGFAWVVCYPGDQSTPLWLKDQGCSGVEYNVIEEGAKYGFKFSLKNFPRDGQEWMTNVGPRAEGIKMSDGSRKWIYNDGKPVQENDVANYRKTWVPDYEDELFIQKYTEFLQAALKHYQDKGWEDSIEFVEVASFGSWGEGHMHMSWPAVITPATRRKHLKMYHDVFKDCDFPIITPRSCVQNTSAENLINEYGFGVGDWSVQVPDKGLDEGRKVDKEFMEKFYRTNPVAIEHHPYTMPKETYYNAVNDAHVSYARLHANPYNAKESEWTDKITKRLGYRLVFEEVEAVGLDPGAELKINFKMKNAGAAPNYIGGNPTFYLKDKDGKIVAQGQSDFDIKSLQVAESAETSPLADGFATFKMPSELTGRYTLCVAVCKNGKPFYNLPLDNGIDKVYPIASILYQ